MEHIIPIASDHGGFEMKEFLIEKLKEAGYMVKDFGTYSNESVDYPDMIHPLALAIEHGEYPLGIILCGSGNGAQMTANHHHNVRAALCWNVELAKLARSTMMPISLPCLVVSFPMNLPGKWCKCSSIPILKAVVIWEE